MKCKSCGGEINPGTGKCPYCGTYTDDVRRWADGIRLELSGPGEHTITGKITIPFEARRTLDNETGMYILKKRFAEMFAEQIENYIQIVVQERVAADPLSFGDLIAVGRIVVKEVR